jgi:hypothetical protein
MIVRDTSPQFTSPVTRNIASVPIGLSVSHSGLELFGQSPLLFHGIYISKTIPRPEPTPQMALGTVFHALVLEPETADQAFAVLPKVDGRTTEGKAVMARFNASVGRRAVITQDQYETVRRMAESTLSHPMVSEILSEHGETEIKLEALDKTGLLINARLDKLTSNIVELKSASDPSPVAFSKAVVNYGYARQAAMYYHICKLLKRPVAHIYHIVTGSTPPYETVTYELEPNALSLGAQQIRRQLDELIWRFETGDWHRWQREIVKLQLPTWAYPRAD